MSEPFNHHFLPVFYLKAWTDKNGQICWFHRFNGEVKPRRKHPTAAGFRHGLYSLAGHAPDTRNIIETDFMTAAVDTPGAKALSAVIGRTDPDLSAKLREDFVRFLMSIRLRSPAAVDQISKVASQHLEEALNRNPEEYDQVRKPNDPATAFEWLKANSPKSIENFGKKLLPGLIDNEKIGTALMRMKWQTIEITGNCFELLTSDTPLRISSGLGDKDCLVTMPLTPRLFFAASNSQEVLSAQLRNEPKAFSAFLNDITVTQAHEDVFGKSKSQLKFIENRLGRNPKPLPI